MRDKASDSIYFTTSKNMQHAKFNQKYAVKQQIHKQKLSTANRSNDQTTKAQTKVRKRTKIQEKQCISPNQIKNKPQASTNSPIKTNVIKKQSSNYLPGKVLNSKPNQNAPILTTSPNRRQISPTKNQLIKVKTYIIVVYRIHMSMY